jgi:hypothetical protein
MQEFTNTFLGGDESISILLFLNIQDVLKLSLVCKRIFFKIDQFWRIFYQRDLSLQDPPLRVDSNLYQETYHELQLLSKGSLPDLLRKPNQNQTPVLQILEIEKVMNRQGLHRHRIKFAIIISQILSISDGVHFAFILVSSKLTPEFDEGILKKYSMFKIESYCRFKNDKDRSLMIYIMTVEWIRIKVAVILGKPKKLPFQTI